jgi:hypothetical protein
LRAARSILSPAPPLVTDGLETLEMDATTIKNTAGSLTHFEGGELGGNAGETVGDTAECDNVAGGEVNGETGEKVDLTSGVIRFNEPSFEALKNLSYRSLCINYLSVSVRGIRNPG